MCAIIGVHTDSLSQWHLTRLGCLMQESQIRGRHATGISWVQSPGKIHTRIVKGDAQVFQSEHKLDELLTLGDPLSLIGHCRYSTSDLKYNQPIVGDGLAIVHNGVVTQMEPELWPEMFNLPEEDFSTRNDSEIVFLLQKKYFSSPSGVNHPLVALPDASLAVASLDCYGGIEAFHNEKRPLWNYEEGDSTFYFSTKDIGIRAGLEEKNIKPLRPSKIYTIGLSPK